MSSWFIDIYPQPRKCSILMSTMAIMWPEIRLQIRGIMDWSLYVSNLCRWLAPTTGSGATSGSKQRYLREIIPGWLTRLALKSTAPAGLALTHQCSRKAIYQVMKRFNDIIYCDTKTPKDKSKVRHFNRSAENPKEKIYSPKCKQYLVQRLLTLLTSEGSLELLPSSKWRLEKWITCDFSSRM